MKKIIFAFIIVSLFIMNVFAQSPNSFKYQAVVRSNTGNPIANQNVNFQINIIQDSSKGLIMYSETHSGKKTNSFGLINLDIGSGTIQYGNFNALNWGKHQYYIGLNVDPTGGTNYSSIGIYELLSVPYALYAENSGSSNLNLTGTGSTTVTGTYPNYIINSNYQSLKLSYDTLYLSNGGFVKLPYSAGTGIGFTGTMIINTMPNATHTGDATGSGALKVVAIQGNPVDASAPSLNQVLSWNGSSWIPSTISGSGGGIAGAGATNQVAFWTGSVAIGSDCNLYWDNTNKKMGIGNSSPNEQLEISKNFRLPMTTTNSGIIYKGSNPYIHNYGVGNTFMGINSGNQTMTGSMNTGVGYQVMNILSTGSRNSSFGDSSLAGNTSGNDNVAIGYLSLYNNVSLGCNTAVGSYSMDNNWKGTTNTALGYSSLNQNVTGGYNTALGAYSMKTNQTGMYNTAIGYYADLSINNLTNATAIGNGAVVTGNDQIRLGNSAVVSLYCMGAYTATTNNASNLYVDNNGQIMRSTSTGGSSGISGTGNTGYMTFWNGTSSISYDGNLFWDNTNKRLGIGTVYPGQQLELSGNMVLANTVNNTGIIYKGTSTFIHNYGMGNTFLGLSAGNLRTSTNYLTGIGCQALTAITTGWKNTAIGYQALYSDTSGKENTAVGCTSLNHNFGASNTAIGSNSLFSNTSGTCNISVGSQSLLNSTTGIWNSATGTSALYYNTTGSYNTAMGGNTLSTNTTGNYNTSLGYNTDIGSSGLSNATAIGYGAIALSNNYIRVGNSSVITIGGAVGWSNLSDARHKKNISEITFGLDFINKLRPLQYQTDNGDKKYSFGFVAQDIKALLGNSYGVLTVEEDSARTLGLRYGDFIAPMVKAIQEQQTIIINQQNLINDEQDQINRQQNKINELELRLEKLENK